MRYDLAALSRRVRNSRRRAIVIRDIVPPATMATNLYLAAYKPVVELWQRRADAIIAEYERTLSTLTTDSPADLQAQLDAADNEFERLFILLNAALSDWSVQTERWQRNRWTAAVLSASGVDIKTMIGPEDVRATVGTYLQWNAALIRDISNQARKRISDAVFGGLQQRKAARDVAKEVREATGMARDRSVRVASDQMQKMTAALAAERRREAGLTVFKWRHSGKLHPRSWHRQRDGHLYSEDAAMVGREVDGQTVADAPPADDRAGVPPYCGCREQGVLVLD